MALVTREFGFQVLHQNQANFCVVQTSAPTLDAITNDAGRPSALAALTGLLASAGGQNPKLIDAVGANRPVIVLLPEYALGRPDWEAVDALVRAYPAPLVLIAGFGATLGSWLSQWAQGAQFPSPTTRFLAEVPTAAQRYNGGWCWIKSAADVAPECATFFKGFEEQGAEAVHVGLGLGLVTLALEFTDLVVIPAICADLICSLEDGPRARIVQHLAEFDNEKKRLVVGLLLQSTEAATAFPPWNLAIATLCAEQNMVVLSNHSNDSTFIDENSDSWRSISGAYTLGSGGLDNTIELVGTRGLSLGAVAGMVVRRSRACVTIGAVRWPPYGATTGRHLWPARRVCLLGENGGLAATDVQGDAYDYEIPRWVGRFELPDPHDPLLGVGLGSLTAHLETADQPRAKGIVQQSLNGIYPEGERPTPRADKLETVQAHLKRALYAIGYLSASAESDWQREPAELGQLKWVDGRANLLVWHERERPPHSVKLKLEAWVEEGGAHPPLQVVIGTMDGDLDEGEIKPTSRTDFTQSSESGSRDITETQGLRRAWFVNLAKVSEAYGTPSNDSAALDNMIETLKNQLAA